MSADQSRELVLEFFSKRFIEPDRAFALLADDAVWIIPGSLPMSGTHQGKTAIIRDYLSHHTDDFKTVTSTVTRTIAEDDVVVVEYHAEGVTRKDRVYDTIYYYVVDVADGKIIRVRQSLDTLYTKTTIYD